MLERSLVAKMAVAVGIIVGTILSVAVAVVIHLDIRHSMATLSTRADLSARMVADGVAEGVWNLIPEEAALALEPLRSIEDFAGAVALGTRGEVFHAFRQEALAQIPADQLLTVTLSLQHPDKNGRIQAIGTLQLHFDLRPTKAAVRARVIGMGVGGLLLLIAVLGGTVFVMRRMTRPIVGMTGAMADLAAGEVDIVVPDWHRADEIGRMAAAARTFQRNALELREAKECAERAMVAKAKFFAAASHDLRQPVQSLMMFMEVLRLEAHSPGLQETVDNLDNVVDVLKNLLDDLLDVSRLDAGSVKAKSEAIDADQVLRTLHAQFAPVARNKGLALRVSAASGRVRSDRVLLLRLLGNLIDNAIRYTPTGAIEIVCKLDGDRAIFEVRDTGIGIQQSQIEAIWEEFHQVGNPERNRDNGIGLGLAIVKRLSGILGHPVTVRSIFGEGSVFSVTVPLAADTEAPAALLSFPGNTAAGTRGAAGAPPTAASAVTQRAFPLELAMTEGATALALADPFPEAVPAPVAEVTALAAPALPPPPVPSANDVGGWSVLVIDDDAIVRTGLELFMGSLGYRVHVACDGTEALALVAGGVRPDIVVSDHNLSGDTGLRVVERLWAALGARVPAAILSGHIEPAVASAATGLGVQIAQKPLSPTQLTALMRALVERLDPAAVA